MTVLYTMFYTAYVTAVACFALWATHQIKVRRYRDAEWEVTLTDDSSD